MSTAETEEFKKNIVLALSPYLVVIAIALLTSAFTAGGAWYALNSKLDLAIASDKRQDADTEIRVKEWTIWRRQVDLEVDRHSNRLATIERRLEAPQRTP